MNALIQDLTTELKSNPKLKDSAVVRVVLEGIQNSITIGVPSDQILETALTNLNDLAVATVNEDLKEVVTKFRGLANKPTKRLQNMAKEAGISLKIKALKESAIAKDPTFAHVIAPIEQAAMSTPEFRLIGPMYEALSKFAYDGEVSKVLEDLVSYVNANRAKLEIMNAMFEMQQAGAVLYKDALIILEQSLLEEVYSADALKIKLRGNVSMPITNRLVNTLSMMEAKEAGKFNIGLGNGDTRVTAVIAPFLKLDESNALILLDNSFVKLTEGQDPTAIALEEAQKNPEFYALCEAYARLNFQDRGNTIVSKGRHLEIAFAVNESGDLHLKINDKNIDDLTKVNVTELFMMEQIDARQNLAKVFNGLDMIVNLEFAKHLVNERMGTDAIVFTMGEDLYVFEKLGGTRVIKKMKGLAFHTYVMEKFQYDVSELYSIELGEREMHIRHVDEEKSKIEKDIEKLETSKTQLDEMLKDTNLDPQYELQLQDLRSSIEKNVRALKNHYIAIDQSKKKA